MNKHLSFVLAAALASSAAAQTVNVTANLTIGPTDTSIVGTGSTQPVPLITAEIVVSGASLTINGRHSIASLSVNAGGVVTHDSLASWNYAANGTDIVDGMQLTISGDVSVDAGGAINMTGRGHVAESGPGGGLSGPCGLAGAESASGGGHGGAGGASNNNTGNRGPCFNGGPTYGAYLGPINFGSGGGRPTLGGSGGGVARIAAGGTITIDGELSCNGTNGTATLAASGGGSGGSISLAAPSIAISGSVIANGGRGTDGAQSAGGSGGGGRVTVSADSIAVSGVVSALGGIENQGGGAGTVLYVQAGVRRMVIDNGGLLAGTTGVATGGTTDFDAPVFVDFLEIRGRAYVSAKRLSLLRLRVKHDLLVDQLAGIWVTGRGYNADSGPGGGTTAPCGLPGGFGSAGGSHGGRGGRPCGLANGTTYGSADFPRTHGSGGGGSGSGTTRGGEGGGAAEVVVGGTFTLDGSLQANGINSFRRGGGAGGSLLISAQTTIGSGNISARGGNGLSSFANTGGTGGGGRIAIYGANSLSTAPNIGPGSGGPAGQAGSYTQNATPLGLPFEVGTGCAGMFGFATLSTNPSPPGNSIVLQFANLGTQPTMLVLLGLLNSAPYPIDLTSLGMPSCQLFHDVVDWTPVSVANGEATYSLPTVVTVQGTVFATGLVSDPTANAFGFVVTNAVSLSF